MPRISHVAVAVTITEDDGTKTVHHASGFPVVGSHNEREHVEVSIVPRWRTRLRRSTGEMLAHGVEDVAVTVKAILTDDGMTRLFAVDHEGVPTVTLYESAIES